MTSQARNIEKQAQMPESGERARLALRLIESLDPGTDEDTDELRLDEAERRISEYDAGNTDARPVDDVIAEIEQKLG